MIDWIKLETIHPNPEELLDRFDFIRPVNIYTADIKSRFDVAVDKGLKITLYTSGRLHITGSLHKFWKGNNYTNFSYAELTDSIRCLCEKFGVSVENWKVLKMEYGVNIETDFAPKEFLERLICLKYQPLDRIKSKIKKFGFEHYFTDWGIKLYDKSELCKLPFNLLRIEKKVTKSRALNKLKIYNLSDLTLTNLTTLGQDLLDTLNQILVDDKSIDLKELKTRQKIALANYRNPKYWPMQSRHAAPKAIERFKLLMRKYGNEKYYEEVINSVQIKWKNLCKNNKVIIRELDSNLIQISQNYNLRATTFANTLIT